MKISRQSITLATSLALVAAGTLSLSSCGGDDSLSGAGGTVQASAMGAAAAIFLGGNRGIDLEMNPSTSTPNLGQMGIMGLPSFFTPLAEEQNPFESCSSSSPAQTVDDDQDNIPKIFTQSYDCADITMGDVYTYSAKGEIKIQDLDDTKKYTEGGYRYDIDYSGTYTNAGFPYTNTYKHVGFFESRVVGGSFVYKSEFSAGFGGEVKGFPFEGRWQSNYETVYTPEDVSAPWNQGKVSFNGYIALQGNFSHEPEDQGNYDVAWELSSNGLEYDWRSPGGCSTYKAGSLTWKDGEGKRLVIEYNCTSRKIFYQGQEISLQ